MSLVERATVLRDLALGLVKIQGSWHEAGPARLLIAEQGDLMIAHRTPFQKLRPASAEVKYGAKPFAIDVWHKQRAFFLSNGMMMAQPMSCRTGPAIGNMN